MVMTPTAPTETPQTTTPEPQTPPIETPAVEPSASTAAPPVAAVPAEASATVPTSAVPTPPAVSPEVQAYQARLEEQVRTAQEQNDLRTLQETTDRYAQGLAQEAATAYGLTPEQVLPFVQKIAKQHGDIVYKQYQAEQSRRSQLNAAFAIAQEHGADPRTIATVKSIMNLANPEAMREAAKQATEHTTQAAEIARLKTENEALKKGRVPPQNFAAPGGAANQVADNSNIDGLWMKWERENPNSDKVNPYEAQYRKFLYGR